MRQPQVAGRPLAHYLCCGSVGARLSRLELLLAATLSDTLETFVEGMEHLVFMFIHFSSSVMLFISLLSERFPVIKVMEGRLNVLDVGGWVDDRMADTPSEPPTDSAILKAKNYLFNTDTGT